MRPCEQCTVQTRCLDFQLRARSTNEFTRDLYAYRLQAIASNILVFKLISVLVFILFSFFYGR